MGSGKCLKDWSWREELNLQPAVYKTAALPLSYASLLGISLTYVHDVNRQGACARIVHGVPQDWAHSVLNIWFAHDPRREYSDLTCPGGRATAESPAPYTR